LSFRQQLQLPWEMGTGCHGYGLEGRLDSEVNGERGKGLNSHLAEGTSAWRLAGVPAAALLESPPSTSPGTRSGGKEEEHRTARHRSPLWINRAL
jgi:hypothetical protein